jgi:hypothetical protein
MKKKLSLTNYLILILSINFIFIVPLQAQQIIEKGLVSYWSFNKKDIDGNTAKDSFGKNNGEIKGCKPANGKYGEALEFDGVSNYVEVPDDKTLQLWENYTIEAWIFQYESRSSRIIDKITAGTADGPHLDTHPGTTLRSCAGNCFSSKDTYDLNEWFHAGMTFNKGKVVIYLNGKANGEGETTSPLAGNALSLKIGADSNGANLFKGIIDEVRIYNIALSANDIKQNMSASSLSVDTRQKLASTWGDIKDKI